MPKINKKIVIGGVLVLLVAWWLTGSLDKPLSNVGLNKNECVTNAFGATFCGDDANRYRDEIKPEQQESGENQAYREYQECIESEGGFPDAGLQCEHLNPE